MSSHTVHTVGPVTADDSGQRLDQYLAQALGSHAVSRSRVQTLMRQGHVQLQDQPLHEPKRKTQVGDTYTVTLPPPEPVSLKAENIPLTILYEDEDLLVLDKPAYMAVHPAPGNWKGTLVNALLHHCKGNLSGIGGEERPGIVHRLDLGTSGVMVVAKNDMAHQHLSKQFHDKTNTRRYVALVYGCPHPVKE